MSFDLILLLAQAVAVLFLAGWLTTGAVENVIHPSINETFTAEVLDMTRMREEWPDAYAVVAYRRVANRRVQRWMFRFIVACELIATVALWVGVIALVMAMVGTALPETARAFALFGTLLFTSVWAGFLVAGNWFCYWFCHDGTQNTHYQMTLWGLGTMIFLSVGG